MTGSIVVTGGGTGGHLKVAEEFVFEFNKKGYKPTFIGSQNGQDKQWFEKNINVKKAIFLNTRGVVNKNFTGKLSALFNIAKETYRCMDYFDKANVKTVVSVGGFSAAPASFAAILTSGCKLYIHKQNSVMGKLNKITSYFATEVFCSYSKNSPIKDYPVNEKFFEEARIRTKVKKVIFLGGSQGAISINNLALSVARFLDSLDIQIIHQTGVHDLVRVRDEYRNLNVKADVFDFVGDISEKMAEADFAISRSGASTLWELTANSLPALFIPYPHAANNHQLKNAQYLENKDLCFIESEDDFTIETLDICIKSDINFKSRGLAGVLSLGATRRMVDYILYKKSE